MESVDAFEITEVFQSVERTVCHAEFFALIYIRGSLHHMKACCQHFCRDFSVFVTVVTETGNASWLVVILPVEAVPCNVLKTFLPAGKDFFHIAKIHFSGCPFASFFVAVNIHMLELEYHVQFFFIASCIFFCFFQSNTCAFAYCYGICVV